jgi:hypothetical protein
MDVSGAGRTGYAPLPTTQDMAAVLAARPAMAEMSAKVATQASAKAEDAANATTSATATTSGSVDMYL